MCSRFDTGGGDRPARDECRRPSLSPRRTADRTGATTKTRRGGEAGRRNAEPPIRTGRPNAVASGCRKETAASPCGARPGGVLSEARHREGTGVPDSCGPGSRRVSRRGGAIKVSARPSLRRTAGRSFLRGEAPRRDGRTRQLRPGIAKGEAVRRGESDGRQDRSDDENAKRRGGEMPSLLFAQAGRTRLQADAGRKRPRPLAAHGREELPPRRGPEKGRADLAVAARDREGRSRRGGR